MGRSSAPNGPGPIQPENILAYQRLYSVRFTDWELGVIEAFDAVAMEAMSQSAKVGEGGELM